MKLIVEMEMPKSCEDCPLLDERGDYPMCIATQETRGYNFDTRNKKMDKCPIKGVLPDEHGDLIDMDIMYKEIELWKSTATDTITLCFLYHIERLLMSIRPTIAAERKDDE